MLLVATSDPRTPRLVHDRVSNKLLIKSAKSSLKQAVYVTLSEIFVLIHFSSSKQNPDSSRYGILEPGWQLFFMYS